MRSLVSAFVLSGAIVCAAPRYTFHVLGKNADSWPTILSSIGLIQSSANTADVEIVPNGAEVAPAGWIDRVEHGTILALEGESSLAESFGFKPSPKPRSTVRNVEDLRAPELRIIWEKSLDLPVFDIPANARVFARERWGKAPLMVGYRRGEGAVLWIAASPGSNGYERFPYIPQALADLGLEPPFRSARTWAFFDSAYRSRVDLDYFAQHWRAAGISALQVAAWHFWERNPESDMYLRNLIEACHRHAISVYAWLELPHVSDKFWNDHPEWREKTALLQDAQLDWRKLVNLTNREAFAAVSKDLRDLIGRFDWDGVNLAELYFESLEGYGNPARFTPLNDDVRAEFRKSAGFDPLDLFNEQSPQNGNRSKESLNRFLDFRAELAGKQQTEWIAQIESTRASKPDLDLVLTHIDDRFDTTMREKLGADTSRVLPLLSQHDLTLLIEDPATIWNLGPQRYPQIAARYAGVTPAQNRLAIDLNIVERYQDVYPTKQQTGTEFFELVHMAANSFPRVALYFENSILHQDLPLLPSAMTTVSGVERIADKIRITSKNGVGIVWHGSALVDGKVWPVSDGNMIGLPDGAHSIEASQNAPPVRLLDLNADLKDARVIPDGLEFAYESNSRALGVIDFVPGSTKIDGIALTPEILDRTLILPRGHHVVTLTK